MTPNTAFKIQQTSDTAIAPSTAPSPSSEPEQVEFEDQVIWQEFESVEHLPHGPNLNLNLVSHSSGREQVQIPLDGDFHIVFRSGGRHLSLIDNNALDGEAIVQLPEGTFEAFIQSQANPHTQADPEILVMDPLYDADQTLTHPERDPHWRKAKRDGCRKGFNKKFEHSTPNQHRPKKVKLSLAYKPNTQSHSSFHTQGMHNHPPFQLGHPSDWYRIGKRQLPTPEAWKSADGQDYVLNFSNQGVDHITLRWYPTHDEPDYPPGLNKIGPAGGSVELPGVGRLEVPAGVLSEDMLVSLSQELVSPVFSATSLDDSDPYDFISPAVRIEPADLTLSEPALLYLPVDLTRVGNNHPIVTDWVIRSAEGDPWTLYNPAPPEESIWRSQDYGVPIVQLGSVAKVMPTRIQPDDGYDVFLPEVSSGFQVQGTASGCGSSNDQPFLFVNQKNGPTNQDLAGLYCFSLRVYEYYANLITSVGGKLPNRAKQTSPNSPRFIPIYIKPDETKGKTNFGPRFYNTRYNDLGSVNSSEINLPFINSSNLGLIRETLAHELWHVFQYAQLDSYFDPGRYLVLGQAWIIEGPAVHMGGSATLQFGNQNSIPDYDARLEENQAQMSIPLPLRSILGYSTGCFFTFLTKRLDGDHVLARLAVQLDDLNLTGSNIEELFDQALGSRLTEHYKEFGYAALARDK